MKRLINTLMLLAGSVGTVNAAQTIIAGPLSVDPAGSTHNFLLCLATNLSSDIRTYNVALINFAGTIVASSADRPVDSFQTSSIGSSQAQLCAWEIDGSPENWRFTACTAQNPNIACTGGAMAGRVAPGVKFPE